MCSWQPPAAPSAPGETVHVTALARDSNAQAIEGLPLTAILLRPDGVEYTRQTSAAGHQGGHVFALSTGPAAPRGTWRIEIKSDLKAAALASRQILVEDFLPERIDFTQQGRQCGQPPARRCRADRSASRLPVRCSGRGPEGGGQFPPHRRQHAGLQWPGFRFGRLR